MNLVEVTIVIVILGVVMAGVFTMITSSTEHFHFARRLNELDTQGRHIMERLNSEIIWAGYMPSGGWDNDSWHPMVQGQNQTVQFYADYDGNSVLDNTDYKTITLVGENLRITDNGGAVRFFGSSITNFNYNYLDENGDPFTKPLSNADLDQVRHIAVDVEISREYGNDIMQSNFHTTISPRNLGLNHNINPAFFPPPPLEGIIAYNIPDAGPTYDDTLMIDRLEYWGLSIVTLTDDEMLAYDYVTEGIILMILRHRNPGSIHPHGGFLDGFDIPIITLCAQDAASIWLMGTTVTEEMYNTMTVAATWHQVNNGFTDNIDVYDGVGIAWQSVLSDLTLTAPDTILTLASNISGSSGICVIDDYVPGRRRVHYSAWDASEYTVDDGWKIFRNVIEWAIGEPPEDLGTPIGGDKDDFEDAGDYGETDPGIGDDVYCYLRTSDVYIPPVAEVTSPMLIFSHVYWTRDNDAGAYLEYSLDDGLTWIPVPSALLSEGYSQVSTGDFPGGAGISFYSIASPGYNPLTPALTADTVDISGITNDHNISFRFVFGVDDKAAGEPDGWVIDDFSIVGTDVATTLEKRLDDWDDKYQLWFHDLFAGFTDDWYHQNIFEVDPTFPEEQGHAWTTWGERGYIGPWTQAGVNDSWEIGKIAWYFPDIDPTPTTENDNHYAGTDLTDDGYYNAHEWSYIVSDDHDMAETLLYPEILVEFYRCVRMAPNDAGWVFIGFSNTTTPPADGSPDWHLARSYDGENHILWEYEVLDLSDEFKGPGVGMSYYFIKFSQFSGPNDELGGWNVDNIQFYGR